MFKVSMRRHFGSSRKVLVSVVFGKGLQAHEMSFQVLEVMLVVLELCKEVVEVVQSVVMEDVTEDDAEVL